MKPGRRRTFSRRRAVTTKGKQSSFLVVLVLLWLAGATSADADTIRLKNGRVIQGQVAEFRNGEFVVHLAPSDPSSRLRDRMILLVDAVESITFDAGTLGAPGASVPPSEKLIVVDTSKEVTPTSVQLRQGDHVTITASGEIQFDDGRISGPAGLESRENWPFPGERFGILVALVGNPQSSIYHLVGEGTEFEARQEGELYLQINAGSLAGARGAYTARVRVAQTTAPAATGSMPATEQQQTRHELDVQADSPDWTDTGIDLKEGDTLRITASGTIHYTSSKTCGPTGGERTWQDLLRPLPVNDAGRGALIGLIGQTGVAQPFLTGAEAQFEVEKDGRLFLGVNDDNYQNNSGAFRVRIEVNPRGS